MNNTVVADWDSVFAAMLDLETNTDTNNDPTIDYDFDPLAFVLAALNQRRYLPEIHSLLAAPSHGAHRVEVAAVRNQMDQFADASDTIRRYFQNRLIMRRLRNHSLSKYMTELEQLLENPRQLKLSQIPILLKLPDFHRESTETDHLFKTHVSLNPTQGRLAIDQTFEFAAIIERNCRKGHSFRYYFANDQRNLAVIEVKNGECSQHLLDYIVAQKKPVIFRGTAVILPQPGHDFLLYRSGDFRFYDPHS
jgi:hypothetical protein